MSEPDDRTDNVRAVGRALEILLAFTAQDRELSAAVLLQRVDLSRPTLYRLLYTLEEQGFVVSAGDPRRFRLGPGVGRLAKAWTASFDLSAVAQPMLQRLWTETEETVALFVPQGALRLCLAELPSPQPLNFKRGVGYVEHIVRGATGKAMLAYMDVGRPERDAWARQAGITPVHLEAQLARTRRRGHSISESELIEGAVAVGVPFFDSRGDVAGSLGVFGPQVRLGPTRQQEIAALLKLEAERLSRALGHEGVGTPVNGGGGRPG